MALPPPIEPDPQPRSDAALRAQILATEHWSLLASRTTTQNEVLTRIAIFLTLVSATLVSVALVGQATGFGPRFPVFAIALLAVVIIVGFLTQLRVVNVSMEDLGYVVAMNRLRAAYERLAPGIGSDFMTSTHDDQAGVFQTYYFLGPRRNGSQILASSMVFIIAVNGALVGLLIGAIVLASTDLVWLCVLVGIVAALVYVASGMFLGSRSFFRFWRDHVPRNPSAT